jgi:hypothetical protein
LFLSRLNIFPRFAFPHRLCRPAHEHGIETARLLLKEGPRVATSVFSPLQLHRVKPLIVAAPIFATSAISALLRFISATYLQRCFFQACHASVDCSFVQHSYPFFQFSLHSYLQMRHIAPRNFSDSFSRAYHVLQRLFLHEKLLDVVRHSPSICCGIYDKRVEIWLISD